MKFLKKKPIFFENKKFKALFREITPTEYILICVPFLTSFVSIPETISSLSPIGSTANTYAFIFVALMLILFLSLLYLIGIRWRIVYFGILMIFALGLIIFIGRPLDYYMTADRDSAIRVAIEAILNGKNPYKAKTNLGNYPTPLPFTFILYLPVYLITGGHTFFMNIIVLCAFCILLFYKFIDTDQDKLILPIIAFIIFSDWYFLETALNSDLLNSILILCMILFLLPDEIPKQTKFLNFLKIIPENPKSINKQIVIFAILLGCLFAMRVFFWLIGFIIALYVLKIYGFKNTFYLALISIIVFLIWILPFMFMDIDHFFNVAPFGSNSDKFSKWRSYDSIHPIGYLTLTFLKTVLIYGPLNAPIITIIIIISSLILGLINCENKLHLLIIITFCFLLLLFFYFHGHFFGIFRDYVSIAAIPFIFSFLYVNIENKKQNEGIS